MTNVKALMTKEISMTKVPEDLALRTLGKRPARVRQMVWNEDLDHSFVVRKLVIGYFASGCHRENAEE